MHSGKPLDIQPSELRFTSRHSGKLLEIQPSELQFPFEPNKTLSCTLQLISKTRSHVAFKVEITSREKYDVHPNWGIVMPGTPYEVSVTRKARRETPPLMLCVDKFQLICIVANPGTTENDLTSEWFSNAGENFGEMLRLKVVYVLPPQPFSPVLEEASSSRTSSLENMVQNRLSNGAAVSRSLTETITGKIFTLEEIKNATSDFTSLVIGIGGFGKVYKGDLGNGELVAIKRANPRSEQGLNEFQTEIQMLSKVRHRHLVSLIGYCHEANEMILVYEYMENGTLRKHLYGHNLPALPWIKRLNICVEAARGLHYLHTGVERGIIHRDVKSTNILLDAKYVAKVSDFGISKFGPAEDHTHVSTTEIRGTLGYCDPEYHMTKQLTMKSDVYSFGVVLLEVLCARPAIALIELKYVRKDQLEKIVDPRLNETYCKKSLRKFEEIAKKCLAPMRINRPTMEEVLGCLKDALELQEASTRRAGETQGLVRKLLRSLTQ